MSTPFQLNPVAQAGFTNASAYDTHRPVCNSYPIFDTTSLSKPISCDFDAN